jgi:DNA-binding Lrp family transcriptional regulator
MKEKQLLTVLYELMKNARQSDRSIAEKLGVSQPTVTRARAQLEKEYINGYTAIPSFPKIGYELIAITFMKVLPELSTEERINAMSEGRKWAQAQPRVVFAAICTGMGMNGVMLSFHESYSDYVEFMRKYKTEWGNRLSFPESIMIYMNEDQLMKPLTLASLIEPTKDKDT